MDDRCFQFGLGRHIYFSKNHQPARVPQAARSKSPILPVPQSLERYPSRDWHLKVNTVTLAVPSKVQVHVTPSHKSTPASLDG